MNQFLIDLQNAGLSQAFYDFFFAAGFVTVFLFVVWYGKKLELPVWKAILIVLVAYPSVVLWMFVMFWIESGFKHFGGNNIVRVFVYMPIVSYAVSKLFKESYKKIASIMSFAPLVVHGTSHWGCIFVGCCCGYTASWGIYNPNFNDYRVPNQPLEALVAWLIIGYLMYRAKKSDYKLDGLEMPVMLILFGYSRFLLELLRDNQKLLLGCSGLAFHALFMGVVGTILYKITKKKLAQQTAGI